MTGFDLIWKIVILGIVLIAGLLVISGKARVLVQAIADMFFYNAAKDPVGAAAVYTEAIEKAREKYAASSDLLKESSGKLEHAKRNLEMVKVRISNCEARATQFYKDGDQASAEIKAKERTALMIEARGYEAEIEKLTPVVADAKKAATYYESKVTELEAAKNTKITELKLNKQLDKMYTNMDTLRRDDDIEKLLGAVEDGLKEGRERVTGARIQHENKLSTQVENVHRKEQQMETDNFMAELAKKHGKQS